MKLNAVGVSSKHLKRTLAFYKILRFEFPDLKEKDQHIESINNKSSTKLMIDKVELVKEIMGENPKPGNHSSFAVQYDSPHEIDEVVNRLRKENFKVVKEPWDAFWGQRYAIVEDPDGYKIDLYAYL
mgnify:CR=1 FL=1